MPRSYRMTRRAAQIEETRRRITEAAVELHESVGPARTTVTAVAERAGVERLTVYRHFPDENALFEACSSHWLAANPPPDLAVWSAVDEPEARLRRGLADLYAWYRRTERMMENFLRDGPSVPALAGRLAEWRAYEQAAQAVLGRGLGARGRRRALVLAVLGHALDFHTWASLARRGLDDATAAELMARLACDVAAGAPLPRRPA
jgi:AcrR family transcriptional regulator